MWLLLASSGAALVAGLACLAAIIFAGRHIDPKTGALNGVVCTTAVPNGALLYTAIVLVVGDFYLHYPVSVTVAEGFGDGRIAWMFVDYAVETSFKVWTRLTPAG
jgi:hypothetical protein